MYRALSILAICKFSSIKYFQTIVQTVSELFHLRNKNSVDYCTTTTHIPLLLSWKPPLYSLSQGLLKLPHLSGLTQGQPFGNWPLLINSMSSRLIHVYCSSCGAETECVSSILAEPCLFITP